MAPILKKCAFSNCNSTSSEEKMRFFHFPKNSFKDWVKACENPAVCSATETVILKKRYVCELHFGKYDYERFVSPFRNKSKLKSTALPKKITGKKLAILLLAYLTNLDTYLA